MLYRLFLSGILKANINLILELIFSIKKNKYIYENKYFKSASIYFGTSWSFNFHTSSVYWESNLPYVDEPCIFLHYLLTPG